jgi:DNA-binding transcriptional LysR family regulator
MDLNCCLAFVAVVECESFSGAARKLQIPRSTVGARVAALETRLGTRLLRRTTRQISLTDDGRSYFEEVAPAIRALSEAEERAVHSGNTLTGSIRISVPLDFPFAVLSHAITSFRELHPDLQFDVLVDDNVSDFIADNIDLAIRGRHPGNDNYVARKIAILRFGIFASPAFMRRSEEAVHDEAGFDSRLAFDRHFDASVLSHSASSPFSRRIPSVTANCFALLKQLAIDGAGAALLPVHMCDGEIQQGRLIKIDTDQRLSAETGLFIVYPSRKDLSSKVRKFSDYLVSALETSGLDRTTNQLAEE